jgi:CheY-like chemotaxis protein
MKNILVIDDNSDMRLMVSSTLVGSGYSVRQAGDGREGIQMVIVQKPDLIICDVRMQGLDGYGTLAAIRKCSGTAAIPFILMTGSMGQNDFRRGMISGADDYLMKPFTSNELNAAVKARFARQTHLHLDIFERLERRKFEEFDQLANEFASPLHGILSVVDARRCRDFADQEIELPVAQINEPVFCLD